MVKSIKYKGLPAFELTNGYLSAVVIPQLGAKIASLVYLDKAFEVVAQNKLENYFIPQIDADFSHYDASGLDDAFPNIDESKWLINGKYVVYPDHGEIWSAKFDIVDITQDGLVLTYRSERFHYKYTKTIIIDNSGLNVNYEIENIGTNEFPCLWTYHGLLRYEPDMVLVFPEEVDEIENVLDSSVLGQLGKRHTFPITQTEAGCTYHLNRVGTPSENKFEKFYAVNKIKNGVCKIIFPNHQMMFVMTYDASKLPYLGFWVTEGGYRGDFNCAFEPSTSYYDNLYKADQTKTLLYLLPNQKLSFGIQLNLMHVRFSGTY